MTTIRVIFRAEALCFSLPIWTRFAGRRRQMRTLALMYQDLADGIGSAKGFQLKNVETQNVVAAG